MSEGSAQPHSVNVQVQAQWVIDPLGQVPVANQIMLQTGLPANDSGKPDVVYVTVGHLNPPVFNNPPGQSLDPEALKGMVVPVQQLARFAVSRDRFLAFADEIDRLRDLILGS